jgi:hypothetical protein
MMEEEMNDGKKMVSVSGRLQTRNMNPNQKSICICCPTKNNLFDSTFVQSLFSFIIKNKDFKFSLSIISYSEISASRNLLISKFYFNTIANHMLFLDDDMGFSANLIEEMIELQEDVVGVVYPKRSLDLEKLRSVSSLTLEKAISNSVEFIGTLHPSKMKKKNFYRMSRIGTGIMLISRQCIARMIEKIPECVVQTPDYFKENLRNSAKFLTFFDHISVDGIRLSEDFSFCERWTNQCGGTIWAAGDEKITHVARFPISARYSDRLSTPTISAVVSEITRKSEASEK